MSDLKQRLVLLARAKHALKIKLERERQQKPDGGLLAFVKYFWDIIEPETPFVDGWAFQAICQHLEAVTAGKINRLLMNVPPGFSKSLLTNVFWPAWEWSAAGMPHLRYVTFSYAASLTERDNRRMLALLSHPKFKEMWGQNFRLGKQGEELIDNDKTGWKLATSVLGVGTGMRGNRVTLDDPHDVMGGESEAKRTHTVQWFREAMSNRLNSLHSDAIIVIMQRVHEEDVSGTILAESEGYDHLCIPMEYDSTRHCRTSLGWEDPRTRDGELAWPDRFRAKEISEFKRRPYMWASQYQQSPSPRGGGIFKDAWWQVHEVQKQPSGGFKFVPEFAPQFVLASLDTAFTEKEENDYSALTVWAVYDDPTTKHRKILLVDGWKKRLELHGEEVERNPGESEASHMRRSMQKWGLVEWVNYTCKRRKVDRLIVENKARGHDVVKEIKRLYADRSFGVRAVEPKGGDKIARAHAIVDLFTDHMIHAPAEVTEHGDVRWLDWADTVIRDMSVFPRGSHDDIVDSASMALRHLRDIGLAIRKDETAAEDNYRAQHKSQRGALYPA